MTVQNFFPLDDSGSDSPKAVQAEIFDGDPGFPTISQAEIDALFADEQDNWLEYWDDNRSIPDNFQKIITKIVILPGGKPAYDIATAYLMIPSQVARIIPILFCHGQRGSGKSTLGLLINAIRGNDFVVSPSDTFASIRNQLNQVHLLDSGSLNPTSCIVWDNVSPETLLLGGDKRLYNMILAGYNRATSQISIAYTDGTNMTFQVFSPKVISSVYPLQSINGLEELARRLLILPHKPISEFHRSEILALESLGVNLNEDLLATDSICWDGIDNVLSVYWSDRSNVMRFVRYRSILSRPQKNKLTVPTLLSKDARYQTCIDVLATGVSTGLWSDCQSAIDALAEHITSVESSLGSESPLASKLRDFLENETKAIDEYNQMAIEGNRTLLPVTVSPTKLKSAVESWHNAGEIPERGNVATIKPVLEAMGWHLTKQGWTKVN